MTSIDGGTLAVIPARAGSKGIPGKNLKKMHDVSLVEWALKFCEEAGFTHYCLSSNSPEILEIGMSYPNCIVRVRPEELALDETIDRPVLQDAMTFCEKKVSLEFRRLVMLQPTAPGRTIEDLNRGLALHDNSGNPLASSVWAVEKVHPKYHPSKQVFLDELSGNMLVERSRKLPPRRQDLSETYVRNGEFYIMGRDVILSDDYLIGSSLSIVECRHQTLNIDNEEDFRLATLALRRDGQKYLKRTEREE